MNKNQKIILKALDEKYGNDPKVNLYPKPMTDSKALKILTGYFLGKDWYVADPLSPEQVNVIMVRDIIRKYKGVV